MEYENILQRGKRGKGLFNTSCTRPRVASSQSGLIEIEEKRKRTFVMFTFPMLVNHKYRSNQNGISKLCRILKIVKINIFECDTVREGILDFPTV